MTYYEFFLLVPKKDLVHKVNQEDREYFNRPLRVVPSYSDVLTRMLYVTDPVRQHTYPVLKQNLKSKYQLTNRQRAAINQQGES